VFLPLQCVWVIPPLSTVAVPRRSNLRAATSSQPHGSSAQAAKQAWRSVGLGWAASAAYSERNLKVSSARASWSPVIDHLGSSAEARIRYCFFLSMTTMALLWSWKRFRPSC